MRRDAVTSTTIAKVAYLETIPRTALLKARRRQYA
jgi:hypothetical protein